MKRIFLLPVLLLILAGTGRGAAAPVSGDGWEMKTVADGITYYRFSGLDTLSGSAQQVFVIDLDLSNPAYAVRFSHPEDGAETTSDVFLRNKAVVAMNACYEASSVVMKVDGKTWSCMPFNTVFTSPVPNWKSEAAIYTDGLRNVRISFDGKDKDIEERRAFYASCTDPNIFSSAPMLIDDYDPVGERFVDPSLTREDLGKLEYEDPARHQGVRHPRTAVAKTEDNHLILLVADGRRPGVSEGMNARELTRFLATYFHPRYALNMDGGGSSTLCVRGEGDPQTHVVNYPTDNKRYDHAGERKVSSHFYIVELQTAPEDGAFPARPDVRQEVLSDWNKSSGLDAVLDWSPKALTPAPKGYKPVYISHYGRHGSRYAYTSKSYTVLLDMLREGAGKGNLTPKGESLLAEMEAFWEKAQYQVGDLTPLGWEQHQEIARTMVRSFPTAFGKGSRIDACSSPSVRAIISMSSCCSALSREAPHASVYAHQGMLDVQATRPNAGSNPFRYQGPETVFPYGETSPQFFYRKFPGYRDVLARLFTDPDAALGERDAYDVFFYLYMLVAGMNSIPEEERLDLDGLLTPEEFATLWETDNYERFREYLPYRTPCSSIVDDMVAKADERLAKGERGADLRFGHDHVVMALLMILDLDGFGYYPPSPDDLTGRFHTFRSPMAANIQMVFYAPRNGKGGEPLVKVLLNGEEAHLGNLQPVQGPYYGWQDVRSYLQSRTALFVNY